MIRELNLGAAMILQRTPDHLTPAMAKALESVGTRPPIFLSIIPASLPPRQCFSNVARLAKVAGGRIVLGWQVHEGGGGRYLKLNQHAVFEVGDDSKFPLESGTLIDPTPPESVFGDLDKDNSTLFVRDDEMVFPKSGGILPSIFIQLDDSQDTAEAIKAMAALDEARKAGAPSPLVGNSKVGRNEPCPCGSGKKFKRCHGGAI
jgi:SEC-C motif